MATKDAQLASFVIEEPAAATVATKNKQPYASLGSAEGMSEPPVNGEASGTGSHLALRVSLALSNWINFVFAASAFIVILAVTKPVNATLYTWLRQGGFLSSYYNVGLAAGIAFCAIALVFALIASIPAGYELVRFAIDEKGVNGLRTIMDIAYDIPIYWFLLQETYDREVFSLIFAVIYVMLKNYVLHVSMDMNNNFIKEKMMKGSTTKKNYYVALGVAAFATLFFWLLGGTFIVDSLIYSTQTVVSPAYTILIIILAVILFLTDFWRIIDYGVRYARMDTGCFQQMATGDAVHAWLTFVRVAVSITMIYIASFCGPLGTGSCAWVSAGPPGL
jgi:hypothetical protein